MCECSNLTVTKCESCNDEQVITEQSLGEGVPFERIRRITGYLVGTVDRFNDAKKKEVEDRVKHNN